jgi:hypothetical protein
VGDVPPVPILARNGTMASRRARTSSRGTPRCAARASTAIGASSSPGMIAFTRTPWAALSSARDCVRALIPAFEIL